MKVVLNPRPQARFGQDLLAYRTAKRLGLRRLVPSNGTYDRLPPDVDLVISHNPDLEIDAQFIQQLTRQVPVAAHIHCQYEYYNDTERRRIATALENVRLGVVPARFLQEYFAHKFASVDWRVAYNGIDATRFPVTTIEQRMRFRTTWNIPLEHKLVAIVGRLENAKGIQIIEEMCKHAGDYNVSLFLQYPAGSRTSETAVANRLIQHNPKNVHVLADANPGSTAIIHYCDLLVSPSLSEACPLVVIEALTAGVPVLGTNSTSFYSELPYLGIPAKSFAFFELPNSCRTHKERSQLNVSDAIARELADVFLTTAVGWPDVGDIQRTYLANAVKKSAISEDAMFRSLSVIYEEASSPR